MKILSVNCFYPPFEPNGGATIYTHSLNKTFQNIGHNVEVFCGKLDTKSPLYQKTNDTFENIKTTRIALNYQSFDDPIKRITGENQILEEFKLSLKDFNPDIVHFHSIQGLGADILKHCINNNYKTAITLHDSWWLCPRQFFLKSDKKTYCQNKNLIDCSFCYGFSEEKDKFSKNIKKNIEIYFRDQYLYEIINNIDLCIFPSHFIYSKYKKYLNKGNWIVSQNGIDDSQSVKKIEKSNKIRFLFVGGNSEEKGSTLLINTWERYFSKTKKIELHIYGQGVETLSNQIRSKNIHTHYTYNRNDFKRIFSNHDVLIFPSIIPENSPITIKEACSFGMAIISSDIGGIPELIKNNINGLIFKNNNQKDLYKKIHKIIKNRDKLLEFQQKSLLNYKSINFQAKKITENFQKIKPKTKYIKYNLITILRNLIYTKYIIKKTSIYRDISLEKQDRVLLFNLDKNRKDQFNKYAKHLVSEKIYEIYKDESSNLKTKNKYKLKGNRFINWTNIKNIIKKNKINTIAIPFSNIGYFKKINQIFFFLIGVKKYSLIGQNIKTIIINSPNKPNKKTINSIIRLSSKFLINILFSAVTIINIIIGSIFTKYGHQEIKKQFIKVKKKPTKELIIDTLLLPLKLIRIITNYLLIKLINL